MAVVWGATGLMQPSYGISTAFVNLRMRKFVPNANVIMRVIILNTLILIQLLSKWRCFVNAFAPKSANVVAMSSNPRKPKANRDLRARAN